MPSRTYAVVGLATRLTVSACVLPRFKLTVATLLNSMLAVVSPVMVYGHYALLDPDAIGFNARMRTGSGTSTCGVRSRMQR